MASSPTACAALIASSMSFASNFSLFLLAQTPAKKSACNSYATENLLAAASLLPCCAWRTFLFVPTKF